MQEDCVPGSNTKPAEILGKLISGVHLFRLPALRQEGKRARSPVLGSRLIDVAVTSSSGDPDRLAVPDL
jgi:hypothetical protein